MPFAITLFCVFLRRRVLQCGIQVSDQSILGDILILIPCCSFLIRDKFLGPLLIKRSFELIVWISNYIHSFRSVIMPPNFNSVLAKLSSKLWHGYVIKSHLMGK